MKRSRQPKQYPTEEQWELFQVYASCLPLLTPMQFLQLLEVTYEELSTLAGTSISTVEHWFASGTSRRKPDKRYCRRLAEIHWLWKHSNRINPDLLRAWCNSENFP